MMERVKAVVPDDDVLQYYFYFIQERMKMFWNRCSGVEPLTCDSILRTYKFTNVYRACDRVSQYLISQVIGTDDRKYSPRDMLLRVLVFKIFNKIETWEYLRDTYGEITEAHFDVEDISRILTKRRLDFPIFNNAYMMTGSHSLYNYLPTKHEKWLTMVKREFLGKDIVGSVLSSTSLKQVYENLRQCSFLGDFLAYQYAIDFNYTPYLNFSENSFVKAGIGAIRGIKKCFVSYGAEYEDAIRYVFTHFTDLQDRYGYASFKPLPGHQPTLLDLQNCFCETDKYLRVKLPDLQIDNVRIKQKYKPSNHPIHFVFPTKWNVKNDSLCFNPNSRELTLF
jgi:hypothetical protein